MQVCVRVCEWESVADVCMRTRVRERVGVRVHVCGCKCVYACGACVRVHVKMRVRVRVCVRGSVKDMVIRSFCCRTSMQARITRCLRPKC